MPLWASRSIKRGWKEGNKLILALYPRNKSNDYNFNNNVSKSI